MSKEQATSGSKQRGREKILIRVDRLRQSRQRSTVGIAELIGLAGSAVMLLAVIFAYLSYYSPAQSRLAKALIDRDSLQKKLTEAQRNLDVRGSESDVVNRINESLDTFENGKLTGRDEGRLALYSALIQLIRSNNLRNTSGPAYTYLEARSENKNQGPRLGNAKWQSLYPGISVTVTVEGQYANLRRFVRDIEASSQFIIINEVELERAGDEGPPVTTAPVAPAPNVATPSTGPRSNATGALPPSVGSRSNLVSLKVDMVAYYRREGSSEVITQPTNQAR